MDEAAPSGEDLPPMPNPEQSLLRLWTAIHAASYNAQHAATPAVPDDIAEELQQAVAEAGATLFRTGLRPPVAPETAIKPGIQQEFDYVDAHGGQEVWNILTDPGRPPWDNCIGARVVALLPFGEAAGVVERLRQLTAPAPDPGTGPRQP